METYHLNFTDKTFVYKGKSYPGIPLLVSGKHCFVEIVCAYLRYLVIREHLKPTSVKTFAQYIQNFFNFLSARAPSITSLESVNDTHLIEWANKQERLGVKKGARIERCDAVFNLCVWSELNGFVKGMVKIPGYNDNETFQPSLSSRLATKSSRDQRRSKYGIVSGVRPRGHHENRQYTPTATEITKLYLEANGPNDAISDRNNLLLDWYVQVGVRRHEWAALTLKMFPKWEVIDQLVLDNDVFEVELTVTKGSVRRYVSILPELLARTKEYIEGPRAAIVARFKAKKAKAYREPDEVFLSNKTGLSLNLTAISNMLRKWFKAAGVNGHGHRLRAVNLTNHFDAEIDAEETRIALDPGTKLAVDYELVLMKVAERAGQRDIASLRTYLRLVRKRRGRLPGIADPVVQRQQLIARSQELAVLDAKIAERRREIEALSRQQRETAQD